MPKGISTAEKARGRWRDILLRLGVAEHVLNGREQACPACGGKDRFVFDDRKHNGDYFCRGCGAGDGFALLMKINGWDFQTAANRVDELIGNSPAPATMPRIRPKIDTERLMRELAAQSRAAEPGDPVTLYLASRGIRHVPPCIRFVPRLKYNAEPPTYHPGMVALFRGPDGKACTFHRTYLTLDGRKADVPSPKRLMAGAVAKGGAIRLFPPAEVLGIAEGIETALSAAELHGIPCWSAISENILRDWLPPAGTKRVVIFGDNDANFVGHAASYDLARRLSLSDKFDVEVQVRLPPIANCDWNDILMAAIARRQAREA